MSSNERLPRTILPKADGHGIQSSDTASEETSSQQDNFSSRNVRNSPQVRSNIRSACLACRQRRSKCTGGSPCSRCQTLGTDCIYEEGQDRRTRAIREKGKEELELHKKVLDGLFRAIRSGGDKSLMGLVKDNATLEEMAAVIDGELVDGDDPKDADHQTPDSHVSSVPNLQDQSQPVYHESDSYQTLGSSELPPVTANQERVNEGYTTLDGSHSADPRGPWSTNSRHHQTDMIADPRNVSIRHDLAPLNSSSTVMLDYVSKFYSHFRETVQHMIQQGVPRESILGGTDIRCDLIFRTRQQDDTYNVYTWASAIVNMFPELDIYFRLSWLVLMVRYMRWSVDMTQDNFSDVPDLMKPTATQISVIHAPFIDLAPLPQLRDALVEKPRDYCSAIQLSGISVSWNRPLQEAVLHDAVTGGMTISKSFEAHISNPDNFIFGRAIFSVFPDLRGRLRVADEDFIPITTLVPSNNDLIFSPLPNT